jgi:hypothetical protein
MIEALGHGPTYTLSPLQSYGVFFSMSASMAACAALGFWLLLRSPHEYRPVLRMVAWPLHITYSLALLSMWLLGARVH